MVQCPNVTYRIRLSSSFLLTQATRRVPHVEQDLLTLPEQLVFLVFSFLCFVLLYVYIFFYFSFIGMHLTVYILLMSLYVPFVYFAYL